MAFRDSKKLEMVDKFKYPNGDIYEGEAYNKKVSHVDMKLKYQNKILFAELFFNINSIILA
jgi:hypothetical protein